MSKQTYWVRDVDDADLETAIKIAAWDREEAASEYVQRCCGEREYYDRRGDIRIGVRQIDRACSACEGERSTVDHYLDETGNSDDFGEQFVEGGGPCPRCPEEVFVVEIEMVPSCTAHAERFDHPVKPARCYDCGRRLDDGQDHSLVVDRNSAPGTRAVRRCALAGAA